MIERRTTSDRTSRRGRIQHHRTCNLAVAVLLLVVTLAAPVPAAPATHSDREATYPDGVANVTHEPWTPTAGDDVVVTLTLDEDAAVPQRVSLVYCRVEPSYVCGYPFFIDRGPDGRTWTGTIEWDPDFMQEETDHVGYNLTLRYIDPSGEVRRVMAPTGNHWIPESFPTESGGVYYFVSYQDDAGLLGALPGPMPLLVVFVYALLWRSTRRGRARG